MSDTRSIGHTVIPPAVMFLADVPMGETNSGAEQVLWQQAKGLVAQGVSVSAVCRSNDSSKKRFQHFGGVDMAHYFAPPARPIPFAFKTLTRSSRLFSKLADNHRIGAVIAHQPFTCAAVLLRHGHRIKRLIYVAHSPIRREYLESVGSGAAKMTHRMAAAMRGWVESFCLSNADRVITLSQYMKNTLTEEHPYIKGKVVVIPGGVDLERFHWNGDRDAAKLRLGLPPNRIHLLTVRNLEARMGLTQLVHAVSRLKAHIPDIHLTIGGSGPECERLHRLVKELDLDSYVQLVGYIPETQLPIFFAAADFFIMPTQALEGFGLVTLESWAAGTPVIGTPVGAIPEVLSTFDSRFVLASADIDALAAGIERAIIEDYRNSACYAQLRHAVHRHAEENFSWALHVDSLIRLIGDKKRDS